MKAIIRFLLGVTALVSLYSCVPNNSAYALIDSMEFSKEGGENQTPIGMLSGGDITQQTNWWGPSYVYLYQEKGGKMVEVKTISPEEGLEQLLPTGEYELDAGWVKFYYPKVKDKIRVVVQPNNTGVGRAAKFEAPSTIDPVRIRVFQSAQ